MMSLDKKITALRPGKPFFFNGEDLQSVKFIDEHVNPVTQEELDSESQNLEYQYEIKMVSNIRHSLYSAPDGSDAIYMQYQRGEKTEKEWLDAVQAINDQHPYPEATA
jgi:hypothetical protein